MGNGGVTTMAEIIELVERDHHAEETRELAFEVWALQAGQNVRQTQAVLQREYDVAIPIRTLYDWVGRYGWEGMLMQRVAQLAPAIQDKTLIELIVGAYEGAKLLRRSVGAPQYIEDADGTIKTDKDGNPLLVPKPDKTEVTSALGLLDRGGFSPLGRTARPELGNLIDEARLDVSALGQGDLRRHEDTLLDQLKEERAKQAQAERLRR